MPDFDVMAFDSGCEQPAPCQFMPQGSVVTLILCQAAVKGHRGIAAHGMSCV